MARPINADAAATRSRVLNSARTLFAQRGMNGVTIRTIAKRAGVTLGTVHHYFGSKESLYRACLDSMYDDLTALRHELEGAVATGGASDEMLERVVRTAWRFARDRSTAIQLIMRQITDSGELDAQRRVTHQIPFLSQASQLLAATFGRKQRDMRLIIQSVTSLIVRYALSSERELGVFAGAADDEDPVQILEDHLVDVALDLAHARPEAS